MKTIKKTLLLIASAFLISGCSFFTVTDQNSQNQSNQNQQQEEQKPFLSKIVIGGYTRSVYSGTSYVFDGVVTACYSDNSTKPVTDYTVSSLDTESLGNQTLTITYTENGKTVSSTITLEVLPVSEDDVVLRKIEASGYTKSVEINKTYTFDGVVKAVYSNNTTKTVTNYKVGTIDTSTLGTKLLKITYVEGTISVFTEISIDVYTPEIQPINVTGVSLNLSSKQINVGESFTLSATVTPSDASNTDVTWSTSNSSIATVTNGVVKGISKGTATITVKTVDQNKTATCVVTVKSSSSDEYETITPEEAVALIDNLDVNEISSKEYYVRGVTSNVELDNNGFNGGFLNTNLKFRSVKGNNVASSVDEIAGKEVVILGYLENYNGTYQIPYLPAYASPTGVKYNGKLISVFDDEEEEIEVTHISVSPVNKTLAVGESATLSATVLPENALNKTVTWSSSNSAVCSVDTRGVLTGISVGSATITAKTVNDLTATCEVTVKKDEVVPVGGDKYAISFNHFESDGQTELTFSTVLDQITSGKDYIDSVSSISKVYKGMEGLKIGSNNNGGSLSFTTKSSISTLNCKEIIVNTSISGTRSKTVNISLNDNQVGSGSSSAGTIDIKLNSVVNVSKVGISTSGRAYISGVTLVCEESTPIPVTAISIPSTKAISTGNSEVLTVTYTPSNANRGKNITWTSSNTSVATVSNGAVSGVSAGSAIITAKSEGGFTATCNVTVSNVSVTSVSLSSTSETLTIGGTKQLTETVLPVNATNKNVTWTSSNTSVATVSSSGLVTAKAVGTTTITVKTADGNKTATCSITVQEQTQDAWTILIYMCGADLESESGLATSDIKEILSVNNQPDNVNIVIETGGSKSWSLGSTYIQGATKIDSSKLSRWHVENKKIVLDEALSTYSSMGASSTLQSFIEYGIKEYPADKTGIIFWNHGGAMYGCCYDEKKNDDSLTNSEMSTAFSKALTNTKTSKLEFVGYDTCLTQVQDIAEFNSQYFNYMIASEESEAGYGWDYDTWVDDLYANKPTETILKAIVDGFIADNGGASSTRSDQTLSYLDLSQMASYKTAFESFASALKSQLSAKSISKSDFASWMDKNVKAFAVDSDSSETYFCLFDVKDMLNKISSNSTYNPGSSYISAVNTAFSNLVKYSVAQKGAGNAYGLGCIYSQGSSDAYYIKQAYTSTETHFTNWLSFLKSYSYLG